MKKVSCQANLSLNQSLKVLYDSTPLMVPKIMARANHIPITLTPEDQTGILITQMLIAWPLWHYNCYYTNSPGKMVF